MICAFVYLFFKRKNLI